MLTLSSELILRVGSALTLSKNWKSEMFSVIVHCGDNKIHHIKVWDFNVTSLILFLHGSWVLNDRTNTWNMNYDIYINEGTVRLSVCLFVTPLFSCNQQFLCHVYLSLSSNSGKSRTNQQPSFCVMITQLLVLTFNTRREQQPKHHLLLCVTINQLNW